MKKIFWILVFALSASCSTIQMDHENVNYDSLLNHYTDRAEYYEGFSNVFQFQATIMNEAVSKAQLAIRNQSFNWSEAQKTSEQAKLQKSLTTESIVFLSFYTVDTHLDDLDHAHTVWRVFLDVNNKRYSGVVKKSLELFGEMKTFFPYHNRFASAYYVTFPVPMINIQDYPMKLTITGTVGSQSISFPAMK